MNTHKNQWSQALKAKKLAIADYESSIYAFGEDHKRTLWAYRQVELCAEWCGRELAIKEQEEGK